MIITSQHNSPEAPENNECSPRHIFIELFIYFTYTKETIIIIIIILIIHLKKKRKIKHKHSIYSAAFLWLSQHLQHNTGCPVLYPYMYRGYIHFPLRQSDHSLKSVKSDCFRLTIKCFGYILIYIFLLGEAPSTPTVSDTVRTTSFQYFLLFWSLPYTVIQSTLSF